MSAVLSESSMKAEIPEAESCCVCGGVDDVRAPEEHDALQAARPPLRTTLAQLSKNRTVPVGGVCVDCARRAYEAGDLSLQLASRGAPPLAERVRALRRRLHELTQRIDVFVVVGAGGDGPAPLYAEDDIIMVERGALAAAAAADDALERAPNARGDAVYQCSVCPAWFRAAAALRAHAAVHPPAARHCCWTCGAQFAERTQLLRHAAEHQTPRDAACPARCPACDIPAESRATLAAHVTAEHNASSEPPLVCPLCFATCDSAEALSAHALRHRQARQFVCGYEGCILRFAARASLLAHIRKCHAPEPEHVAAAEPPPAAASPQPVPCEHCFRTFATRAAMRRHARVHRAEIEMQENERSMNEEPMDEGEVEYLEVETLEEMQDDDTENEFKPDLPTL